MINILFISDDPRASELIDQCQPFFRAKMKLAADFDLGLKEVFDHRPAAVFIQSDIAGVSGETVARHVKTLLRADAPRIILVHPGGTHSQQGTKWFDSSVDASVTGGDLVERFKAALQSLAPELWLEPERHDVLPAVSEPAPVGSVSDESTLSAPQVIDPAAFEFSGWEPTGHEYDSSAVNAVEHVPSTLSPKEGEMDSIPLVSVSPFPSSTTAALRPAGSSSPIEQAVHPPEPPKIAPTLSRAPSIPAPPLMPEVPPSAAGAPPPEAQTNPAASVPSPPQAPPLQARPAGAEPAQYVGKQLSGSVRQLTTPLPEKRDASVGQNRSIRLSTALVVALLFVVAAGGTYYLYRGGKFFPMLAKRPGAPAAPAPAAVTAKGPPAQPPAVKVPAATLPSFVPRAGKDAEFSRKNPGWERYQGNAVEFRLYREQGRLTAVQIISRGKKGLSEGLVTRAVRELTGSEVRTITGRQQKGGLLVEEARLARSSQILIYRGTGGVIRGVVITLS